MSRNDNNIKGFDKLFEQCFDLSEPTTGHFERFEKKVSKPQVKYNPTTWRWLIMAASVVLLFGIWFGNNQGNSGLQLADVSPKMEETQDYFTSMIRTEVEKINTQKTPKNQKLIEDAFVQLETLEIQYTELTFELKESNEDNRVIYAMISNFQRRIEVLQNLVGQIENIKNLKNTNYENYS
jgi:arginine decarboxylase-like protein